MSNEIRGFGPGGSSQHPNEEDMDRYLTNKASALRYPPTPDIASSVREKLIAEGAYKGRTPYGHTGPRRAWVAVALTVVLLFAAAVTVPGVRAFIGDVYVGVLHIFKPEPPSPGVPTPVPLPPWDPSLVGETDLGNANAVADYAIMLPTYPADLGLPDHVYWQKDADHTTVLVWMDPAQPSRPLIALYQLASSTLAQKMVDSSTKMTGTSVNGHSAYWMEGPHFLQIASKERGIETAPVQLVEGNVLVWYDKEPKRSTKITYRLETSLPMEEALKIAESMQVPKTYPTPMPTFTPAPTSIPVSPASRLNLVGEAGLFKLAEQSGFTPRIPVLTDMPELVSPDKVFLQDLGGPAVIMAWYLPGRTDDLRMVLYELKNGDFVEQQTADSTTVVQETSVGSAPARWVEGPQVAYVSDGKGGQTLEKRNFISSGHTLVWQEHGLTYRLETSLSLEEAVKIAQSLR
jgi:hypothetical protein